MKKITFIILIFSLSIMSYGQCNYSIKLIDSYGDGWNGALVTVLVNGVAVESLTEITLSVGAVSSYDIPVSTDDEITTQWVNDGLYPSEVSYQILDTSGVVQATSANASITTPITANCPSCLSPTNLGVVAVSTEFLQIEWDSDSSNFDIEYGPTGFVLGEGISDSSSTTTYTLTGLQASTSYDIYVRNNCGTIDGTSEWVSIESFHTATAGACGDILTDSGGAAGDYAVNEFTIVTAFPDNAGDLVTFTFLDFDVEGAPFDYMVVYDGPDTNSDIVDTFSSTPDPITSTHASGALTFLFTSDVSVVGAGYEIQVSCAPPPSCIAPTDLAVSDVTIDGATIAWTSDGALFNIEYGPAGFTQGDGTSDTSTVASYDLSGLNSGSAYDVYVQTDCGATDGTSDWKIISVSTLVTNDSCDTATVVDELPYVSNGDASSATNNNGFVADCGFGMNDGVWYTFTPTVGGTLDLVLTTAWDSEIAVYSGSCGVFTCVDYQDDPEPQTISISVVAGTQYWVNIGSFSGSSDLSEGPYEFRATSTDASLGIEEASMAQFTYFPNPVNDVLTIKAQKAVEDITVFNMLGQVVKQQTPNTMDCTVDLSAMQSGAYFVQVSIGNTVETVRVLKK